MPAADVGGIISMIIAIGAFLFGCFGTWKVYNLLNDILENEKTKSFQLELESKKWNLKKKTWLLLSVAVTGFAIVLTMIQLFFLAANQITGVISLTSSIIGISCTTALLRVSINEGEGDVDVSDNAQITVMKAINEIKQAMGLVKDIPAPSAPKIVEVDPTGIPTVHHHDSSTTIHNVSGGGGGGSSSHATAFVTVVGTVVVEGTAIGASAVTSSVASLGTAASGGGYSFVSYNQCGFSLSSSCCNAVVQWTNQAAQCFNGNTLTNACTSTCGTNQLSQSSLSSCYSTSSIQQCLHQIGQFYVCYANCGGGSGSCRSASQNLVNSC